MSDDTEKRPVDLIREQIATQNPVPTEETKEEVSTEEETVEEEESTEEVENEEEEVVEETEAELKKKKERDRIQRRINKEVASRKAAEAKAAELERILAARDAEGEDKLTKEEVLSEAERIANEKLALKEFNDTCAKLATAGNKADPEFDSKVKEMAEFIGPIPGDMIGILGDIENGGEVLAYLVDNIEEAEKIYGMSPARMAINLAKLSNKLEEKTKPKVKPVSKLPPPNTPIKGASKPKPPLSDQMSMEDWIAQRNKEAAEKRKAKFGY